VSVYPKNSEMDRQSEGYSAIIGIAVLQNFITTFDFDGDLIALERI
jgi:hypothetical protein